MKGQDQTEAAADRGAREDPRRSNHKRLSLILCYTKTKSQNVVGTPSPQGEEEEEENEEEEDEVEKQEKEERKEAVQFGSVDKMGIAFATPSSVFHFLPFLCIFPRTIHT